MVWLGLGGRLRESSAVYLVLEAGVIMLPGLPKIKTRAKPATTAGKREIFGKMVVIKA